MYRFPKLVVFFLVREGGGGVGPNNQDDRVFGSILGSPYLGISPYEL